MRNEKEYETPEELDDLELDSTEQETDETEKDAINAETQDDDDNDEEEAVEDIPQTKRKHLMTALLSNDGENNITNVKDLFKSIELNGEWFRHNLSFILTVTVCLLLFVTNRYQAQQEQIEEAQLKSELKEMEYKWLTRFSELTTSTRQSRIEDQLKQNGDSTLTHSKEAPFIIRATK